MKPAYDAPTAITFLMVGLGAGAMLALLMKPKRPYIAKTDVRNNPKNGAFAKSGTETIR